ncbi:MAG: hypothetical protein PVH40_06660 [Gemmatimonadales bacterium]|jgi:hypothetical protein
MGELGPFLVPITMFLTIGAVLIFRGPMGKAIGERIAGKASQVDGGETEALRAEVEDMRYRIVDLEERVDFTERMLAKHRDANQLPPGEVS